MVKTIRIEQVRGFAQCDERTRKTVRALGCRGIGSVSYKNDSVAIRGMLNRVQHLVNAELTEKVGEKKKMDGRGYTLG